MTYLPHPDDPAYVRVYDHLWLTCLDPEQHERTCNYWYTITNHATAHTAFTEKEELLEWLSDRGLKIPGTLPEQRGEWASFSLVGSYREACYFSNDEVETFKAIKPLKKIAELSNANYTLGKVTEDDQGVRTIHYLNPNVVERIVFPYTVIDQRKEGWRQLVEDSPDTRPAREDGEPLRMPMPWFNGEEWR